MSTSPTLSDAPRFTSRDKSLPRWSIQQARATVAPWLASALIVAFTTVVLQLVRRGIGLEVANVSLGYIVAVLLAAISNGLGPGVLALLPGGFFDRDIGAGFLMRYR